MDVARTTKTITSNAAVGVARTTRTVTTKAASDAINASKALAPGRFRLLDAQLFSVHIIAVARDAASGRLGIGLNDENFVIDPGALALAAGLAALDKVTKLDDVPLDGRKLADVMADRPQKPIHVLTVHRYREDAIRLSTDSATPTGFEAAAAAPAAAPASAAPATSPAMPVSAAAPAAAALLSSAAASAAAPAAAVSAMSMAALRPITSRVRLSGSSRVDVAPLVPMSPLPPIPAY